MYIMIHDICHSYYYSCLLLSVCLFTTEYIPLDAFALILLDLKLEPTLVYTPRLLLVFTTRVYYSLFTTECVRAHTP